MNILITGGAGYIGTALAQRLAARSDVGRLVIYDNLSRNNHNLFLSGIREHGGLEFTRADILDGHGLAQSLRDIDVVYHLAASVSTPFANDNPHSFEQVNHWGSATLASALEDSKVQRIIYVSSTSVYGPTSQPVDETTPCHPAHHYALSKYRGEQQLARLARDRDVCIVRCGNVYGYSPSMRFDAVVNRCAFEAGCFNRVQVYGSGMQKRACINIDDVSETLIGLLTAKDMPPLLNLSRYNLSMLDITDALRGNFPSLELMFVDQHWELPSLEVVPSGIAGTTENSTLAGFEKDIKDLASRLSLQPLTA